LRPEVNEPAEVASGSAVLPANDEGEWTRVIRPRTQLFELPLREIWRYRDLVWMLAVRSISTTYKQTVLGPFWFILQPLMVTAVFSFLFGRMAQFQSDSIPHYLFYMGGLVPWNFFSETVTKTSNIFVENAQVFSKVYFPRFCVPLAVVISNLVPTLVQLGLFVVGVVFYVVKDDRWTHPNWWILATPLVFVQLAALALGFGCIVSALSRRFRDLTFGVRIGLQLLMFGSAIVFPITRIAPGNRWLFFLNPVVPPIEFFRFAFVGRSLLEPWHMGVSMLISFTLLFTGILLFHRADRNAMDTV
jgi:lipopolysaccharide transport system permease protein